MLRKGKCLEKILSGLLICSPILLTSCATTHNTYSKVSRREAKPMVIVDTSSIEPSVSQPSKDIDSIISANTKFSDYLTFRNKYEGYSSRIKKDIEEGNLSEADRAVIELGRRLKNDPSPYAKQYFDNVRNFSYIIFEVNDKYEEKTKLSLKNGPAHPIINSIFTIPMDILFLPFDIINPKGISATCNGESYNPKEDSPIFWMTRTAWKQNIRKKKEQDLVEQTYDKIIVTPYTGTKRKIGENIPYSRLRGELR